MNCWCRRSASASVDRPVEGEHAAERRERIARERLLVGLADRSATADPQGLLCLTITHAGWLELVEQPPGRVEVEHVVERERLAVLLATPARARARERPTRRTAPPSGAGSRRRGGRGTSRSAITQCSGRPRSAARTSGRSRRRSAAVWANASFASQCRVSAETLAARVLAAPRAPRRSSPASRPRRRAVVLGRRADHRRAADVDVLDRLAPRSRPAGPTVRSNG